ncbi:hypothetical protein [Lewinella sp. IMCC34191]|uniref:hypothetical protein n=1 Tax=Lewinella sp. IMCC34191 TaxID=2259172 RepID=UPI000E21E8C2|nr:hypothetical protein [Lewinella sp. IMCC34191]
MSTLSFKKNEYFTLGNRHLVKLWGLTLLFAPFVYAVIDLADRTGDQVRASLDILLVMFVFSVVLSLPTLVIAFATTKFVLRNRLSIGMQKAVNVVIAAAGLICTLLMMDGSLVPALIKTYVISLGVAAIVLEISSRIIQGRNTKVQPLADNH